MVQVAVVEAQQRLPELLNAVEEGEEIEIRAENGRTYRLATSRPRPPVTGVPKAGSCQGLFVVSVDFKRRSTTCASTWNEHAARPAHRAADRLPVPPQRPLRPAHRGDVTGRETEVGFFSVFPVPCVRCLRWSKHLSKKGEPARGAWVDDVWDRCRHSGLISSSWRDEGGFLGARP